jgi:hypothetical protein
MINHDSKARLLIKRLCFDYMGGRFNGRGILSWKPDKGFHIEATVKNSGKALPPIPRFDFSDVSTENISETPNIKIWFQDGGWAVAKSVFILGNRRALKDGFLLVDFDKSIFFERSSVPNNSEWWTGSATFAVGDSIYLSDIVETKISIGTELDSTSQETGLFYEDETVELRCRKIANNRYEFKWALLKIKWDRKDCWEIAEAARWTLSILFGCVVRLLKRKITRGQQSLIEVQKQREGEKLQSHLSPCEAIRQVPSAVKKANFIKLLKFLIPKNPQAEFCKVAFYQIYEVSRQKHWQAKELLLATILEAFLRSIENRPFKPRGKGLDLKQSLERFRCKFLTDKWKKTCALAIETQERLRHRNAHPDWLVGDGGAFSKTRMDESFTDMCFLSQFYGYMILAIAGLNDLEPRFRQLTFSKK